MELADSKLKKEYGMLQKRKISNIDFEIKEVHSINFTIYTEIFSYIGKLSIPNDYPSTCPILEFVQDDNNNSAKLIYHNFKQNYWNSSSNIRELMIKISEALKNQSLEKQDHKAITKNIQAPVEIIEENKKTQVIVMNRA